MLRTATSYMTDSFPFRRSTRYVATSRRAAWPASARTGPVGFDLLGRRLRLQAQDHLDFEPAAPRSGAEKPRGGPGPVARARTSGSWSRDRHGPAATAPARRRGAGPLVTTATTVRTHRCSPA